MGNKSKILAIARAGVLGMLLLLPVTGKAQTALTLDSCRAMALSYNKQMGVARVKQQVNTHLQQSARTKYLPRVNAAGGYMWMSRELSILNDNQKSALSNMGSNATTSLTNGLAPLVSQLPTDIQGRVAQDLSQFAGSLNQVGLGIVDGFRTDTRNTFFGAVTVTQPLYMGGAIKAANKIADINVDMAANSLDATRQNIIFNIDHAYWQVVSLSHKQKLADSYVELVKRLQRDVQKMIDKGVAVKGDGLTVGVRVNEAEIASMEVNDGLALSKMLLCQLCGLPVDTNITLAEEAQDDLADYSHLYGTPDASIETAISNRPELKLLQNTIDLTQQTTKALKAEYKPQIMLTGGYALSNPNAFNGFEKKFGGFWNLGLLLRIPIWNWGDVKHKVHASEGATAMARLELDEAQEMVELQVNQSVFRVNEANKKLEMAQANVDNANENLRMANLGFKEGTVTYTTVMEAQTAWQLAHSKIIDALIGVKLSQLELQKSLGTL